MNYRIVFSGTSDGRLRRLAVGAVWLLGSGALVGLVFVGSFYLAMQRQLRSTEVEVPELAGMTLEEARRAVEPAELVLNVVDQRHDPGIASGRVLQQTPPAGFSVRRGRKVQLVLSLGGRVLRVPEVVGHAARAVEIELRQEGFAAGEEARIWHAEAAPGSVIAQVPPANTPAVPDARVHLLVSQGPAPRVWVMPDLTGRGRAEVERWLELAGFRRGAVRRVPAAGRPRGTVVGQSPLAGYPVRLKDIVELTIAD